MAAGVATSGHCVVPLLAEDMGGPVGACAHNLVGWSCGGWPRALPRHFCICIHLGPSGPACLQCRTFSLHPLGLACRLAPAAWSLGGRIGPRLVSLSLALAALLARNRSWLRTGLPSAWLLPLPLRPEHTCEGSARWLRVRRCFAEPPFPPFPGLGLPPCPWRFGWRFSPGWRSFPASFRSDFHQSNRCAFTGPPAPPFADFNSYPKARIYVFNGDNRFIPLAFLPPSIPGYTWMVSPSG